MKKIKQFYARRSIKQKWTIVSALTIVISYALISGILYIAVYNWLLNDEERTAERTALDIQSFFVTEGDRMTVQLIKRNTSLINAIVDKDQTVRIYNYDHVEIIRINDTFQAPTNKPTTSDIRSGMMLQSKIDDSEAFVMYLPIQIGLFEGYLELIHPLSTFHSMMNYMLTLLILLGFGAVIIATTLSRYIASLLLKPIQQLRDSMATVRDQGLEAQPIIEGIDQQHIANDEIGDLLAIYHSMLDELKESFDRQQQFVQDASHELRTPIQAIEGHLSLINRWGKNNPLVLEESIQTSLEEVRKMKKLMEELLLLARNEAASKNEKANIVEMVHAVREELLFIHPNVELNVHVEGKLDNVRISEQALRQIVRNIVENAIHYNVEVPNVIMTLKRQQSTITLTIEDNGIGIDEKHLPYIFNRFYRVDDVRTTSIGSTGLGLSITKMLADKYNVQLYVQSKVNVGTKFTLEFPIAQS
jgi:two-component system, OmpR family, sensor histidine kinase ArlS